MNAIALEQIPRSIGLRLWVHSAPRSCGGLFIALVCLALGAVQAQDTNYMLGTTNLLVGPSAGSNSVVLAVAPQSGLWMATPEAAWLHLSPSNQNGAGSTNVIFSFDANPGPTRSGALSIGGQALTVIQAGSTYTDGATVTTLLFPQGEPVGTEESGVAVDGRGNAYTLFYGSEFETAFEEWKLTNNSRIFVNLPSVEESPSPGGLGNMLAVDNAGNVYVADIGDNAIKEWTPANSNLTTLVGSGLNLPVGVAVDVAGNVYIANSGDNTIKEWTAANSNLTTLVGSGLNNPCGVAVDGAGNVYITDTRDNAVKKWTAANATLSTVFSLSNLPPVGVAVDGAGNVYVAGAPDAVIGEMPYAIVDSTARLENEEAGNDQLPAVLPVTENLEPFAPSSDQSWLTISGITNGVVSFSFTANAGSSRTGFIDLLGCSIPVTQAGLTTNVAYSLGTSALWEGPSVGSDSVVLAVMPATGAWTATNDVPWLHLSPANQGGTGSTNVIFSYDDNPGATRSGTLTIAGQTLTVNQAGSTYVVAGAVTVLVSFLSYPMGVAVDGEGNVYIADSFNNTILEWTAAKNSVTTLVSSGLNYPGFLAVDGAANVYIADSGDNAVKEWTAATHNLATLLSLGVSSPYGLTVDSVGNVYIADPDRNAIREWMSADSNLTTLVSMGLLNPISVALDAAGNVYCTDYGDNTVKKWWPAMNTLSTLVSSELLGSPTEVAVDAAGNIYIADAQAGAIKELPHAFVDPTPKLESLAAGNDSLPAVLPITENLLPPFAPTSDQPWLSITGITNGVVSFSFTANSGPARTAHVALLGETIPITQGVIGTPPTLTGGQMLSDGVFQFTFTNTPGAYFTVLSTTNLSLPLSQWTVAGTATNTAPTQFQFTSQPATNETQIFYGVRSP
jgi:sugar lactone lactonase YvrE